MRFCVFALFFSTTTCCAQWEAEMMIGVSGYQGDLTKRHFVFRTLRPAVGFNLKYNIENTFIIRGGIAIGKVIGYDKYNKEADLKARNLNFQSNIVEASLCAEVNLMEPEIFFAYPYLFGGIGLFHFDPYTFDNNNNKTYLRPLSTEGQGLADYRSRKPYAKTQVCIPFGFGWKINISKNWAVIYEVGYRALFTDYLDDVSATYVDPQKLLASKGPKALELAYRALQTPGSFHIPGGDGDQRGNSKVKDWYFMNGVKLLLHLGYNDQKTWKN